MEPGDCGNWWASRAVGVRGASILVALLILIVWPSGPDAPRAQELTGPCAAIDLKSEAFLACLVAALKAEESKNQPVTPVLVEPLRSYLVALEDASGYQATMSDLDELKRRSIELKRDPKSNREAIALLDSAIASHAGELRPILDARTYAGQASPGSDIYRAVVQEMLAFLDSDGAKSYDRGPYEEYIRSMRASVLEADYFLEKAAGRPDESKLNRELEVLREGLDRLTRPEYDYILPPEPGKGVNGYQFWRASVLFLLNRISESREILRDLAIDNQKFGLYTVDLGHIYLDNVFALPAEMIVLGSRDKDGKPAIDFRDPNFLDRLFNPAQLALVACAHLEDEEPDRLRKFMKAVGNTVFSDYYVVAASLDSQANLRKLQAAIDRVINSKSLSKERDALLTTIKGRDNVFSAEIEHGARLCGVADSIRDQIYWEFQFRSQIERLERSGKYSYQLLFGGRLNASQARAVSDFLNKSIFRELGSEREGLGIRGAASIARMRASR